MGDFGLSPSGVASGLLLSIALHAPAVVWVGSHLFDRAQSAVETLYEVELLPDPASAPAERSVDDELEPEEEEPTPPPPEQALAAHPEPPPPPAAAKAGQVLTAPDSEGDPEPLDFTMVQGEADRYAGGITAAKGTSDRAVRDPRARGGLPPGPRAAGTGSGIGRAAPTPDRTRPARPVSTSWNCPFPAGADEHHVHYARVQIVVTVRPNGSAARAAIISDPGFGFAGAARSCAMQQRFAVARDSQGRPVLASTPPFVVTFTR